MFKAGIYKAKIYGGDIYTGSSGEYVAPPVDTRRCRKWCSPSQIIRTTIRTNRGMMSRFGSRMSSGRMTRVGR